MLLIFSHKLTDFQIKSAKRDLEIEKFEYLPEDLQYIWSHIPPEEEDINLYIEEIVEWIKSTSDKEDIILVQGDFGATYEIVKYCKSKGLRVIYSTTKRVAKEVKGKDQIIYLTHKVSHVMFREY